MNDRRRRHCRGSAVNRAAESVALLVVLPIASAAAGFVCWFEAVEIGADVLVQRGLVTALITINLLPATKDFLHRRFDPFSPKHAFLGYFFIIHTLPCAYAVFGDVNIDPSATLPWPEPGVRVQALSATLIGLCAFVSSSSIPRIRTSQPKWTTIHLPHDKFLFFLVAIGLLTQVTAIFTLLRSNGGLAIFLRDLASWRTAGVNSGAGPVLFAIALAGPASVALWMVRTIPSHPHKIPAGGRCSLLFAFLSLFPIALLGFRILLLPAVLQYAMVWHYYRRPIPFSRVLLLGSSVAVLLTVLTFIRDEQPASNQVSEKLASALPYRAPGLDTVERVVSRIGDGIPYRGLAASLLEASTVAMPRSTWPSKPTPAALEFADLFFGDYFLNRGDPLDSARSGISPTVIGEAFWIGGLAAVVGLMILLGGAAAVLDQIKTGHGAGACFIFVVFAARFALFAEAPQNTLNGYVLMSLPLGILAIGVVFLPSPKRPAVTKDSSSCRALKT